MVLNSKRASAALLLAVAVVALAGSAEASRNLLQSPGDYGGYGYYGAYDPGCGGYGGYGDAMMTHMHGMHAPGMPVRGACGHGNCGKTYTAKRGDTCEALMSAWGMSWELFHGLNWADYHGHPFPEPFDCTKPLPAGQIVCAGAQPVPCARFYTVSEDDDCSSIMYNTGLNAVEIWELNPSFSCQAPVPRTELCIEEDTNASVVLPEGCGKTKFMMGNEDNELDTGVCQWIAFVAAGVVCPDFLKSLAGNDLEAFAAVNPGIICSDIMIGQLLCIPRQ